MENFKHTYGPMLYCFTIALIVAFAMTSCSTPGETRNKGIESLKTEGLDRLMVEECGHYKIIPSKGMAIDTSIMAHKYKWRYAFFKLNSDSTRYIMCK